MVEDPDTSAWEKMVGYMSLIFSTLDSIISLMKLFEQVSTIVSAISGAQAALGATQVTNNMASARAKKAEASAAYRLAVYSAVASAASLPYPANIAAMPTASAAAVVALAPGLTPFADGGIVSGPTRALVGEYAGAKNNPEVIAPLNKLKTLLDDGSSKQGGGEVSFRVEGQALVGVLNNFNRKTSKYK